MHCYSLKESLVNFGHVKVVLNKQEQTKMEELSLFKLFNLCHCRSSLIIVSE